MAQLEIIKSQTSEFLRKKASSVDKIDKSILKILDDMTETLHNAGANGLAAPQVGISLRLIIVKIEKEYVKLINPTIVKAAGEQISLEGCLSLPGVYGRIKRPEFIVVQALDTNGKVIEMKARYRLVTVFAHEIDHLDGVLFIDKAIEVVNYRR